MAGSLSSNRNLGIVPGASQALKKGGKAHGRQERSGKGLKMRKKSPETLQQRRPTRSPSWRRLDEMLNRMIFGRVWSGQGGTQDAQRHHIAASTAMQRLATVERHIANGLTRPQQKEITEILMQRPSMPEFHCSERVPACQGKCQKKAFRAGRD